MRCQLCSNVKSIPPTLPLSQAATARLDIMPRRLSTCKNLYQCKTSYSLICLTRTHDEQGTARSHFSFSRLHSRHESATRCLFIPALSGELMPGTKLAGRKRFRVRPCLGNPTTPIMRKAKPKGMSSPDRVTVPLPGQRKINL